LKGKWTGSEWGSDLGKLENGKVSDLIMVSGDSLNDIQDVANVQYVMKNVVLMSIQQILVPFAVAH
jgi:imidazolonepropionase-like amidohydrolase